MTIVKAPEILKNLLSPIDYVRLKNSFNNYKQFEFQSSFSRYVIADNSMPILKEYANLITPVAQKIFNSKTLMPTYALFSHYEGKNPPPSLYKHKDDNACTYTIDMCLYQTEPWDLYVDDKAYTLFPNEALAYYGNDQWHWRDKFPNPENQHVAMIFFHFAEPDHWYFAKGPSYLSVIRNEISEKDWEQFNLR